VRDPAAGRISSLSTTETRLSGAPGATSSWFPMSTDDEVFISWNIVTCFSAFQVMFQHVCWFVCDSDSACPKRMAKAGVKNRGLS
jgi:hypothetical protein